MIRRAFQAWERTHTFDLSDKLIDVVEVISLAVVRNTEFSVGSGGGAITVGQIIDHDWNQHLLARSRLLLLRISEIGTQGRNLRDLIYRRGVSEKSPDMQCNDTPNQVKVPMLATLAALAAKVGSVIFPTAACISAA